MPVQRALYTLPAGLNDWIGALLRRDVEALLPYYASELTVIHPVSTLRLTTPGQIRHYLANDLQEALEMQVKEYQLLQCTEERIRMHGLVAYTRNGQRLEMNAFADLGLTHGRISREEFVINPLALVG
jgi:ketosteroid isomerase-like protein